MQTPELPRTGYIFVDVAMYVALTAIMINKGLAFMRAQGILSPRRDSGSTAAQKAANGGGPSGLRSAELWEYKIREIVREETEPLLSAIGETARELNAIKVDVAAVLAIMERPHRRE